MTRFLAAFALLVALCAGGSHAADYPTRPVNLIVAFTPGARATCSPASSAGNWKSSSGRPS